MIYVFSLVPLALFLAVLKYIDSFTLVTWKRIAFSFGAGSAVCLTALLLSFLAEAAGVVFYAPAVEEILKSLVLILMVGKKKIVFIQQALCYGAALGAGFAFAENIIYIHAFASMSEGTAVFRGMGTAVMHMVCPMTAASFFAGAALAQEAGKRTEAAFLNAFGLIAAISIHAAFNMMLVPLWMQLALTLLVFFVLVALISSYNEHNVTAWLDSSINNDINLLTAISEGHICDTNQGRYLLTVKSQFTPETVVDMMCYIKLYLELTIEDKSRLMLREAGLDTPRTAEQIQRRRAAVAEFRELRSRIGRTGEAVLAPIVKISRDDAALMERN